MTDLASSRSPSAPGGQVGAGAPDGPGSVVEQFRRAAAQGRLDQPGQGRTADRFDRLAAVSRGSLGAGRLFEAHADGQSILLESGCDEPERFGLLGVWASEGPGAPVRVVATSSGTTLHGTKSFCSGAPVLDHALLTVGEGDDRRLVLIAPRGPGVVVGPSTWVGPGMRSALTRSVELDGAPVLAELGGPGWYLRRSGFWHGAVGVAASWFGGAVAVCDTMAAGVAADDPHALADVGAADALVYSMQATLERAAGEIDRAPGDVVAAQRRSLAARRTIASGCIEILELAAAALGPRAMAFDAGHAERIADLDVYVRQEHGRRDAAQLGRLVTDARTGRC
jgi:alkylation response protein AidB-like acyl-CoA dehydrogenase